MANSPLVMRTPEPQVVIKGFGASSIDYLVQFWIEDYAIDRMARDQVRTNIWYTFRRHNIEIPWPDPDPVRTRRKSRFAPTRTSWPRPSSWHASICSRRKRWKRGTAWRRLPSDHLFAAGEAIVRQDAEGDSMFVLLSGQARVLLEPSGQEVAVIPAGGFFGEMSMLTGDRRTATVKAMDDTRALEISAADFRELARRQSHAARSHLDRGDRAPHRPRRCACAGGRSDRARSEADLPRANAQVPARLATQPRSARALRSAP